MSSWQIREIVLLQNVLYLLRERFEKKFLKVLKKFGKSGNLIKNSENWFKKIEKSVIFWIILKFRKNSGNWFRQIGKLGEILWKIQKMLFGYSENSGKRLAKL